MNEVFYREGKFLKHYRIPGSKNGYTKDPNYKPIGAPADPDRQTDPRTGINYVEKTEVNGNLRNFDVNRSPSAPTPGIQDLANYTKKKAEARRIAKNAAYYKPGELKDLKGNKRDYKIDYASGYGEGMAKRAADTATAMRNRDRNASYYKPAKGSQAAIITPTAKEQRRANVRNAISNAKGTAKGIGREVSNTVGSGIDNMKDYYAPAAKKAGAKAGAIKNLVASKIKKITRRKG